MKQMKLGHIKELHSQPRKSFGILVPENKFVIFSLPEHLQNPVRHATDFYCKPSYKRRRSAKYVEKQILR
jgi:hypothetical protein